MWSRNRQKNRQKPTKNRQSCRFRKICLSVFVGSETDKTKPTKTVKNRQKPLSIYNPAGRLRLLFRCVNLDHRAPNSKYFLILQKLAFPVELRYKKKI
jgi:hypothetical protein